MANIHWEKIPAFYHTYLHNIDDEELVEALQKQETETSAFLKNLPPDKWNYRYATDKWSIKEMVQHLIDAERIFCYRALVFARKDKAVLPGFDENSYAEACHAEARSAENLMEEIAVVQKSSRLLFQSFDAAMLAATGVANGNAVYVEAIGFIIAGHGRHHMRILKERYL